MNKKKICLINGSPRGKKAVSFILLEDFSKKRGGSVNVSLHQVGLKTDSPASPEILEAIQDSDGILFAFPLYAYTLPGALTKLLLDYVNWYNRTESEAAKKVYAMVNCGFPDPSTNREALRVMELFCLRTGLNWRFGVAIGGGLIVAGTRNVPIINAKLKLFYRRVINDLYNQNGRQPNNMNIKPFIPKKIMIKIKDSDWAKKYMSKKK
jgi:hypothetical protein